MDRPRLPDVVKKVEARPQFVLEEALEEAFSEPRVPRRPAFVAGKALKDAVGGGRSSGGAKKKSSAKKKKK